MIQTVPKTGIQIVITFYYQYINYNQVEIVNINLQYNKVNVVMKCFKKEPWKNMYI